jgi:ubiquitin C-terminal hydrolase
MQSVKRARVKKLPPYLIFTLNRFTYSVEFKKKLKLGYKVDIPESIELVEYVEGADRICTYDLYAVIVHRVQLS